MLAVVEHCLRKTVETAPYQWVLFRKFCHTSGELQEKKHTKSHRGEFERGLSSNVQVIGKRTATKENLHSTITRSYVEQAYCRS